MGSADDGGGSVMGADQFGGAEGDQFEVAFLVDDEVVRFEVADHYLLRHEVL